VNELPLGRVRAAAPLAAVAVLAAAGLAACGSNSNTSSTRSATTRVAATITTAQAMPEQTSYPLTIDNCGTTLTFDRAPTRAVSNDVNSTEDMLALGLTKSMVGTFGVAGDQAAGKPVAGPYEAAYRTVRAVSPDYFRLEPLVGLRPDFLFAGWNYGLETGTNLTPDGLARYGIRTLALTESCAHVQKGKSSVSIEDTYTDLTNLGKIFNVQDRADQLVTQMRRQVASVQAKVTSEPAVPVFLYDSGTAAPFTAPALAMPDALITLAGGHNIFGGLKQSWTSVSWEQVVADKPQCIVINDYGTPTWQQKLHFLRTNKVTKNLPAIRNDCVTHLSYDDLTPSPLNAQAVTAIAHLLHPNAFGLHRANPSA